MDITNQHIALFTVGMTFMMMLFMFLRSFQPNGEAYLKYAVYLLCMNVFFGLMYYLWYIFVPSELESNAIIHFGIISTFSQILAYIFYFSFVSSFLSLRKTLPDIDSLFKYVRIACWLFLLATLIIVYILKNGWLANRSFEIARMALCLISLYGIIRAYKLKHPLTNYFVVGSGLYLVLAIVAWIISIYDGDVRHYSTLKSIFAGLEPAVIAETICFALGLSYRDTELEREKQTMQQQLIEQLEITNKNQREFSDQLEEKVNAQTEKLVQLQREKFDLEKIQAVNQERGRIARDMHDDLGSGLSAIHLLSNYLKENTVEKYPELSHEIGKISSSSEDLNQRIREIIWTTNTRDDSLQSLVLFISRYSHELQEKTKTKISVDTPDPMPTIALSGEERKHVFLCIKEALNNALKHGKSSDIHILISVDQEKNISIRVVDNGTGFNTSENENHSQGNGLRNIKERMKDIGGDVFFESGSGGTEMRLILKSLK